MSSRVDFYLLDSAGAAGRARLVCRLAAKAYRHGARVYIHARSEDEVRQLDDLLWTFSQGSFVPHAALEQAADRLDDYPVLIGQSAAPGSCRDVLISLQQHIAEDFGRFQRVIEPIDHDEGERATARERYRAYRARGAELNIHHVSPE